MKVLFDQGTPVPLRKYLAGHDVATAFELGWARLENGELLQKAESEGFEVFVTTDQNLKYQQNFSGRNLGIVVLSCTSWPRIQRIISEVVDAIENNRPGSYVEVAVPPDR